MIIDGQTVGANGSAARSTPAALSSDFNTFLRMLTVQMQNQNPLNPMEASDFAVQLATFSQVEQQVRSNDLLAGLGAQLTQLGMSQLASWIGLEARVSAPITPNGTPTELAFTLEPGADSGTIIVRNMSGGVVQRLPVAAGQSSLSWLGEGLAPGAYQLEIESYSDGAALGTRPVEHYAKVSEASGASGDVILTLATGTSIAAGSITAYRAPKS